MKQAGLKDFERGERSSTAKHLSVLEYKIQQDKQRLEQIENSMAEQTKELADISNDLAINQRVHKTYNELDCMGKKKMFGKVELPEQDYKEVMMLAKEAISPRGRIDSLERQLQKATTRLWEEDKLTKLVMSTRDFMDAMRLAPQRVKELFADIFQKDKEEREGRKFERKKSRGLNC